MVTSINPPRFVGGSASARAIAVLTRCDRLINLLKQNSAIKSQDTIRLLRPEKLIFRPH
ncbi:hypothetical protein [Nostoc sp. C110]|uniref:hypothetical protein n=1 Tax=Nostoc sp. C110 TaxID=3349876 RepID=UPI00370D80C5